MNDELNPTNAAAEKEKTAQRPALSLPKSQRGGGTPAPETPAKEMERTIRENVREAKAANLDIPPRTPTLGQVFAALTEDASPPDLTTIPTQEPPTMSTQDSDEQAKPPRNIHNVKMSQDFFEQYRTKKRIAQVRYNDRGYHEGDLLIVQEYSDLLTVKTGREFIAVINDISNPPGLLAGHVLMHARHLA